MPGFDSDQHHTDGFPGFGIHPIRNCFPVFFPSFRNPAHIHKSQKVQARSGMTHTIKRYSGGYYETADLRTAPDKNIWE